MATDMKDILGSDKPVERPEPEPTEKPERAEREPESKAAEKPSGEAKPVSSKRREHQRREWEAQGRDPETGQFVSKEAPAAPDKPEVKAEPKVEEKPKEAPKTEKPAQQDMTDREKAFLKAAQEERRKRQELEARFAQQAKPAAQPAAEGEKPKTFWDDPEGALKASQQSTQQTATNLLIRTSDMIARRAYPDYQEKLNHFREMAATNPLLGQQFLASDDPAEFVYKTAKSHMELAQAGSIENIKKEVEAKARADERAKVEAEYRAKAEEAERQRAALTPTLSDVRGAGSKARTPTFAGPTPMGDILKH